MQPSQFSRHRRDSRGLDERVCFLPPFLTSRQIRSIVSQGDFTDQEEFQETPAAPGDTVRSGLGALKLSES